MNNILSQIQHFNADAQINKLHMMYERNSLLNSLSVSRREISHSMFIAELLKENSFHGTGTKPLQLFLETILHRAIKQKTRLIDTGKEVMFPTLKSAILARNIDISDIEVSTEEGFSDKDGNSGKVDILVSCRVRPLKREENNKEVEFINIIIENKVYSKEQDDQTEKYYKHFNAFLKNRASERVDVTTRKGGPRSLYNLYVYLVPNSPSEIEPIKKPVCKCKEYIQICYQDIDDDIKALLKRKNSHRDRSKYSVTLHNNNQIVRNLSRGRLVLTILQDYVESVSINKDDLIEVFQLPQNVLKEYDPSKKPGYTGFFDRDVDILYLDNNDQYFISKCWSENNIKTFINAAIGMNYSIEKMH